jgi:imidazolonepropionase-like amidohydrolase
VWEELVPPKHPLAARVLAVLSPEARKAYAAKTEMLTRESLDAHSASFDQTQRFKKMIQLEMQFEVAFARAGGMFLAGPDGVVGGDVAGFGDQRELELLVEAGFTPVEAIHIATWNGAKFLRQEDHIGSLGVDKQADTVIVRGDPTRNIRDVEQVEVVFKDGVGYDSKRLIESVRGLVGIR